MRSAATDWLGGRRRTLCPSPPFCDRDRTAGFHKLPFAYCARDGSNDFRPAKGGRGNEIGWACPTEHTRLVSAGERSVCFRQAYCPTHRPLGSIWDRSSRRRKHQRREERRSRRWLLLIPRGPVNELSSPHQETPSFSPRAWGYRVPIDRPCTTRRRDRSIRGIPPIRSTAPASRSAKRCPVGTCRCRTDRAPESRRTTPLQCQDDPCRHRCVAIRGCQGRLHWGPDSGT